MPILTTHLKRLLAVSNRHIFLKDFIATKKKGNLAPIENKPKQEDILNAILPPREWVETGKFLVNQENLGKHYIQYVSH